MEGGREMQRGTQACRGRETKKYREGGKHAHRWRQVERQMELGT